jgi:hypothetical protein
MAGAVLTYEQRVVGTLRMGGDPGYYAFSQDDAGQLLIFSCAQVISGAPRLPQCAAAHWRY